jgi:hypothetical protein
MDYSVSSRPRPNTDFVSGALKKIRWNATVRFWYRVIWSIWGRKSSISSRMAGLESHANAIERLLDQLKLPSHDPFRTHQDVIQDAYRAQERIIAHVRESGPSSVLFLGQRD